MSHLAFFTAVPGQLTAATSLELSLRSPAVVARGVVRFGLVRARPRSLAGSSGSGHASPDFEGQQCRELKICKTFLGSLRWLYRGEH